MKKETYYCDSCKDECEFYIHINLAKIYAANGNGLSRVLGIGEIEITEKTFCSPSCIYNYIEDHMETKKNRLYVPGDQIGQERAGGGQCEK